MPESAWIVNLVVLGAVYEADLGRRKVTWFRLLRPLVLAGAIIAYYLKGFATRGDGLTMELGFAVVGVALGIVAGALFRIVRDEHNTVWSIAGFAYAALWATIIAARLALVYSTRHTYAVQHWLGTHRISADALTDALIVMAAGMLLARTASLVIRARHAGDTTPVHRPVSPSYATPTA